MIVTCPNCQTRYNLPDDKVPPGGAKVKCSKCAHVFKAELPPATPEEEVENLFDEQTEAPDTGAGDDFDDAFGEVAAGGGTAEEETPAEDPVPQEEPADDPMEEPAPPADDDMADPMDDLFGDDAGDDAGDDMPDEDMPDEDMPGMDDLFDDTDDVPAPDEGPRPTTPDEDSVADDVESLFGDDEDDLFGDDDASDDAGGDDLFDDDDDGDDDDLFSDEDEDDDEYEDDDEDNAFLDEEPTRKKGGKSLGCLIIILVLAIAIGAAAYFQVWKMFGIDPGAYLQNVPYIGKMFMEETVEEEAAPGESPADKVRKIELKNVKQYYVANEKTGNLFVVEGKAINKFAKPKEQIKVEVALYDGTGNVLVAKTLLCGNVLSQFQLQVQTQKEIEDGLSSEVGILSNNTFIRPGASTPFMAVFFQPPAGVKEFLVKVVDVSDPE